METEQLIELLHTLFVIFLTLTIILVGVSVALFFLLRIKEVFDSITGRAVRRTVQEMEEANNATGRLRKVNKIAMGEMTPASLDEGAEMTTTAKLEQESAGDENTSLLNDGTQNTTLLNSNETSVLSQELITPPEEMADVSIGKFELLTNIMYVHTEEVI